MHSRWKDLTEASGEISTHGNQSLDSRAEGPDEPDRGDHHPPPSGQSGFLSTLHPQGCPDMKIFFAFRRCFLLTHRIFVC